MLKIGCILILSKNVIENEMFLLYNKNLKKLGELEKKKKKKKTKNKKQKNTHTHKDVTLENHLQASSENKHCVCQIPFKSWTLLNIMVV